MQEGPDPEGRQEMQGTDRQWRTLLFEDVSVPISSKQADQWSLVLLARDVPHRLTREGHGYVVQVPEKELERALYEIRRYREESRGWPPSPDEVELADNALYTLIVWGTIAIFNNLTFLGLAEFPHSQWLEYGSAHAGRILQGELWRLVTALTLHVDWQHLLANILIGSVFLVRLCRDLGEGTGWVLFLLSGVGGNLFNALLQAPDHRSVGASTAIFGAVGILTGLSLYRNRGHLLRRWPMPLAAGLALLALLGAGEGRTDIGAHLFGFLTGLPLGVYTARNRKRYGRPSLSLQVLWICVALLLPLLAWFFALSGPKP